MLLEEMRNQSNFSRVRQIFALTFDSQNKLVTEQNIISIPLAPNLLLPKGAINNPPTALYVVDRNVTSFRNRYQKLIFL